MENISKCDRCGETIRWVKTTVGKNMPCEYAGVQGMTEKGEMITVFIPHWGRCIKAKNFRKI